MVARVRTPPAPRMTVQITVAKLAELAGLSRQTMRRRLEESDVVLHRRGRGTQRRHVFVTYADLQANAPWLLEHIESWDALLTRHEAPPPADDDEEDDDDA